MAHRLVELALNVPGDVPYGIQERAIQAGFDRCMGKPEQLHKVSGQINYVALLAQFTEQYKAIEGECEVLDATPIATHSEGEGEKPSNNNDVHD